MSFIRIEGIAVTIRSLEGISAGAPDRAADMADRVAAEVEEELKRGLMSGQLIGRRSGALASSWTRTRTVDPPGATLESAVPYAKPQEYGSHRLAAVPEHARRGIRVRAHFRRMNLRSRGFLAAAVESVRPRLKEIALGGGGFAG